MKFAFVKTMRVVLSLFLLSLLMFEPLAVRAERNDTSKKALTEDQRIRQILSRLTFGARPADLVKFVLLGEISPNSKTEFDKIVQNAVVSENKTADSEQKTAALKKETNLKLPDYVTELLTLALGSPEFQRR